MIGENMKKVYKKKVIISCIVITVVVIVLIIAKMVSSVGNNGYSGKSERYNLATVYSSVEETVLDNDKNYNKETLLYQVQTGKLVIVFRLGEDYVCGYNIWQREKECCVCDGLWRLDFSGTFAKQGYDWKTTVLADISRSTDKAYKKIMEPRESYGVLPAWGVSDTDQVKNMTVDGQSVDHVIEFSQDGQIYYLWIIDDLQTENNAVDIVIDVKEEQ